MRVPDLIQNLSVAGQELRQVPDELLNALQASLLHDGPRLLSNGLRNGITRQILQSSWQVQGCQHPDGELHIIHQLLRSSTICAP